MWYLVRKSVTRALLCITKHMTESESESESESLFAALSQQAFCKYSTLRQTHTTYDISIAILDLDPDLCENLLYSITLSILHIQKCMIHQKKAVLKGFISFVTPKSFEQFIWTLWPKTWKKQTFFLVTESFLCIKSCVMPLFKALIKGFISFLHLRLLSNLWGRYDQKPKKNQTFFLVAESFLPVESCVRPI